MNIPKMLAAVPKPVAWAVLVVVVIFALAWYLRPGPWRIVQVRSGLSGRYYRSYLLNTRTGKVAPNDPP